MPPNSLIRAHLFSGRPKEEAAAFFTFPVDGELKLAQGKPEQAAELWEEVARVIHYLVSQFDEQDLRGSFLRRPAVRAVLDALPRTIPDRP